MKLKKNLSLMMVASALLLVGAGCAKPTPTPTGPDNAAVRGTDGPGEGEAPAPAPTAGTRSVTLLAVAGSGQSGTATFTDVGDRETRVVVRMTGGAKGTAQPAAIVLGDCATAAGNVKAELPSIIDGRSETTLGIPFTDLFGAGVINHSLRVKKDATQTTGETYAACGDLK